MRAWAAAALIVLAAAPAIAQLAPPVRTRAPGDFVVATSRALAPLVRRAAAAGRAAPGTRIRVEVPGSDVAMAALYTARADAAVIGREASDNEIKAYAWIYGKPPVATPVAPGSVATPGLSPALAVRVNVANPLRAITPAQVRAAFRVGAPAPTWGELGLTGAWATRPVHLVVPATETGTGRFLRHVLLGDVVQLDWPRVTEIAPAADDAALDRGVDAAVARDPLALGVGAALADGRARTVAIATEGGAVGPGDPRYPFARGIMLYAPADVSPRLAAFAAALSAEPRPR